MYLAPTNFKAVVPLLPPSVPQGRRAGCVGLTPPWAPWLMPWGAPGHPLTHGLPGVMNGEDNLAAAHPLLTPCQGPLMTNIKAICETYTVRCSFHPNLTSGRGFKRWQHSRSPGLQLQGYCGRKATPSPTFPWHTADLEQGEVGENSPASSQTHQ